MTIRPADLPELHAIYYPTSSGYRTTSILTLIGLFSRGLVEMTGSGMAPIRYITQRGPQQDGENPLDLRWDGRVLQIAIRDELINRTRLRDRAHKLADWLRPNRSFAFDGTVSTLIYRVLLPGGLELRGHDMSVTNGSPTVTALNGRFVHAGGLEPGTAITIGGVGYVVSEVVNDYTLTLTANYAGVTATGVAYIYMRQRSQRDLFCLLEFGPELPRVSDQAYVRSGYTEVLRFVAHDPFWYGSEQSQIWTLPTDVGDLVFDGDGAYFDDGGATGRWVFDPTAIGESVEVKYWGTRRSRPQILITGPAVAPSIENLTTGRKISATFELLAGESATFDTLALTVTKSDGTNLLPFTTGDLATFGIEPDPLAPDGVNEIQVAFSGAGVGSAAELIYRNQYVSL